MAKGRTEMQVGDDGVAVITIINPPVNSLSIDVLIGLKDRYEEALRRNDVKAIVITGAKGNFSGGFDISAFGGIQGGKSKRKITERYHLMKLEDKDIVEMVFFPVVNEACRVLDEGIAVKASDLDIASIMGMGFPPYRGGIMFWADTLGANYVFKRLEEWTNAYGECFKPCAYLAERAAKGIPLSTPSNQPKARL